MRVAERHRGAPCGCGSARWPCGWVVGFPVVQGVGHGPDRWDLGSRRVGALAHRACGGADRGHRALMVPGTPQG